MYDRVDPNDPAYCVGTAGTVAFMKATALALSKYGIRTNGVGPGETRTENKYWAETNNTTDEKWKDYAKSNPLGRTTTPEDVGETVLMIVNDKTSFLNGNIIYINGGGHLK